MKVILYVNKAENERLDKSDYLEKVIELEGTLREPTTLLSPSILFELPNNAETAVIDGDGNEVGTSDGDLVVDSSYLYNFNYAYIEEFGRYYYASDINIVRSNLFSVSLICDVLMSFKDNILALDAFIDRNEFEYNPLIVDDAIPLELNKTIIEYVPVKGNLVDTTFEPNLRNESYTITITITGTFGSFEVINPPLDSGLPIINDYNMSSSTTTYIIRLSDYGLIMNALMGEQSTYASYILSVVAYPFEVISIYPNTYGDLVFGSDGETPRTIPDERTATGHVQGKYAQSFSNYFVIADFVIPEPTNFLECEPFSQYELYLPFYGWTKIDFDLVKGHRLIVYYASNRDDGSATTYVWDMTKKRLVFSTPCQLGIKLALSNSNQQELTAQKNAIGLNLAVGLISSALTIAMGVGMKSPVSVAKGTISGASAITSAINAYSMLFPRASATFSDSATGLYSPMDVHLRITKNGRTPGDMENFRKQFGAPLKQMRTLYQLSGFTIVSEIHLEGINAFKKEKDEIERLLKSGVIL